VVHILVDESAHDFCLDRMFKREPVPINVTESAYVHRRTAPPQRHSQHVNDESHLYFKCCNRIHSRLYIWVFKFSYVSSRGIIKGYCPSQGTREHVYSFAQSSSVSTGMNSHLGRGTPNGNEFTKSRSSSTATALVTSKTGEGSIM